MTRRGLILFALMSLIWGIPYLFIRIAVAEVSPAVLVFCRTGVGALILVPIALARSDLRRVFQRWRWVAAFAAIEMGGPWVLLGSAEQHVTSALAGLLVAGVPLVGTIVALVTRGRDRIDGRGFVGLMVGLVGVAAIVGSNMGASDPVAFLEIALVVVGYAVGPAILARRLDGLSSAGVMALSLSMCAVVYAPIALIQRPAVMPSEGALAAILVLGVVCTAIAFMLFWALIEEIGPVRATVITYVNPAVASFLGVLVLSETFTPAMAIGLALVIAGSTLATRRPRVAEAAAAEAEPLGTLNLGSTADR
jgi:drug/metabolite transporter (DMT)-like permease